MAKSQVSIASLLGESEEVHLVENPQDLGVGDDMKGWDKKQKGPKKV